MAAAHDWMPFHLKTFCSSREKVLGRALGQHNACTAAVKVLPVSPGLAIHQTGKGCEKRRLQRLLYHFYLIILWIMELGPL